MRDMSVDDAGCISINRALWITSTTWLQPVMHATDVMHALGTAVTPLLAQPFVISSLGAIESKIKHAIKLKTSPARLAQLLQPSLAFCFSLQPTTTQQRRTVHDWTVRRHWLQAKTEC